MKRRLALIVTAAVFAFSMFLMTSCGSAEHTDPPEGYAEELAAIDVASLPKSATIEVENFGSFTIEFNTEGAPLTVNHIADLMKRDYYVSNGLGFYRQIQDIAVQGGTPGNKVSGKDYDNLDRVIGEFTINGIDNPLCENFGRGVVAMAWGDGYDSAESTFFIVLTSDEEAVSQLNGTYAAFGVVDEAGMEIVDKIAAYCKAYGDSGAGAISDLALVPVMKKTTLNY